jgi:two-component system, cell cycle sensor histidine kinase and response regulator CckA
MRILIFEDQPLDAELIEYELERAALACDTRRVETREEFARSLEDFRPDLILSDYAVPRFDGMAALTMARQLAPTVPFIIVTGSVNEETAVRCMHAGASDYLIKNNLARLGPAVRSALERERSRAEKLRTEDALRRSEANLRAIFNTSPQGFVLTDPDGTIKAFNQTAAKWAARVGGRQLVEGSEIEGLTPAGELEQWRECFDLALRNRSTLREWCLREIGGAEHWYETNHIPVVDDTGGVVGVCLSLADIDERKRMAEHLLRAERLQASGKLAGGLAHEINNMMTAVIGLGTFLTQGLAESDPRRVDAEEIVRTAERVAGLTRQLLAFTRQQVLRPVVLDLNEVVRGTETMLRTSVGEDVELEVRLGPALPATRADPAQVEQVLMNLVLNARDAIPARGRITIETATVELDGAYTHRHGEVLVPHGTYLRLAVSDTGHGMTPEVRARVFEPFFTTKPVGRGTGLGLSTVYGIVKQSGGFVWAYSEPGQGSTFKVYLPVAEARVPEAEPCSQVRSPLTGRETILVVEDDDVVRALVARMLGEYGYRVVETSDGEAALQLLQRDGSAVDLVVSDVVMPKMGGQELGEALHTMGQDIPVLFISGFTGEDIVRRGLLKPGAPLQEKPFTPETLVGRVREMLDVRASGYVGRLTDG